MIRVKTNNVSRYQKQDFSDPHISNSKNPSGRVSTKMNIPFIDSEVKYIFIYFQNNMRLHIRGQFS